MKQTLHCDITEKIIGCCFDVLNELGSGFLEVVYQRALLIALQETGLKIESEKRFEVLFREQKIGTYYADLVIEDSVIIELKCCPNLIGEYKSQVINYLKVSGILVGLLVNFGNSKLEYKRLYHPKFNIDPELNLI